MQHSCIFMSGVLNGASLFFVPFFVSVFKTSLGKCPRGIPIFSAQGALTLHSKTDGNAPKFLQGNFCGFSETSYKRS